MNTTTQTIQQQAEKLLELIGAQAEIEVALNGDEYRVHIRTEGDASMLIGKHAHMLASLQRVLSAMLFKALDERVNVLVDVNDYRDAQKERLIGIADNVSRRVLDENRPAQLTGFSSYERKIIHEHISQNYLSLESYSQGEGMRRELVIAKKEE